MLVAAAATMAGMTNEEPGAAPLILILSCCNVVVENVVVAEVVVVTEIVVVIEIVVIEIVVEVKVVVGTKRQGQRRLTGVLFFALQVGPSAVLG